MSSTNSRGGTGVKNNLPLTLKPPYVMKLSFPVCVSQALPTLAPVIFGDEELFVTRLLCTVGCFAAFVANSIPLLSFENQKSPDIVKCLLGDEIIQPRSAGLCEDRLYLQIPVILEFSASDCGFYPCAVAVSTYITL